MIKLGVINCADDQNTDKCRMFNINGYPNFRVCILMVDYLYLICMLFCILYVGESGVGSLLF